MLLFDLDRIGDRLFELRKRMGWTQLELATRAGISEHTYLDIEGGSVNTRIDTLLHICEALHITPDAILTADNPNEALREEELLSELHNCTPQQRDTALRLLETYLQSLKQ